MVWSRLATWLHTVGECCSFGRKFPRPPAHILTYEQIAEYWKRMHPKFQKECSVIVLRIRKPVAGDAKPNVWKPFAPPIPDGVPRLPFMLDGVPFIPGKEFILRELGRPEELNDPYTIRIDREWQVQPGMKKHEEVCIANFEL